jgi:hypothetical protein
MDFADCFSREDAHFDCANNFLSVARGNPARGFAIQSVEQPVQVLRAVRLNFCAKTFAEFFRASGRISESFEKCAEVKAGARGEDGKFAAAANISQNIQGAAAKFSGGKDFLRFYQINEVMRNSTLFGARHFRCANIEMAVNLCGIADKNFAAELPGKFDSQRRFSGSSRPED